jgi:hypothetical protein
MRYIEITFEATDAAAVGIGIDNTGEDQFTWTVNNPTAAAPGRQ